MGFFVFFLSSFAERLSSKPWAALVYALARNTSAYPPSPMKQLPPRPKDQGFGIPPGSIRHIVVCEPGQTSAKLKNEPSPHSGEFVEIN
jgi:hypothetical protein